MTDETGDTDNVLGVGSRVQVNARDSGTGDIVTHRGGAGLGSGASVGDRARRWTVGLRER
ncbi:hypothetical protein [Rhodococcus sp. ARC_M6]|uniref:hypothetical protein n=1 Tax=Rhodococcus sp. ARC_M6 TaxID=2928852 RepID=UPI0027E0CFCD|nr:hypothetical protein [Rhodococcus sp. ARC_M6]